MGGARDYWQNARLLASCATSACTRSAMKTHSSKRSTIRQVLRFAAQPPMHFRTMPLDPAPDYRMVYGPAPLGHDLFQAPEAPSQYEGHPGFPILKGLSRKEIRWPPLHHLERSHCLRARCIPGSAPSRRPAATPSTSISFISATIRAAKQVLYRQTHYISRISTPRREALIRRTREIPIPVSKPGSLHLPRQALTARAIRKSGVDVTGVRSAVLLLSMQHHSHLNLRG